MLISRGINQYKLPDGTEYIFDNFVLCRRRQQHASIDVCLRSDTGQVAQVFRMRSDYTMLAFGENGFVQTAKNGNAFKFGPVMMHNFLLDFNIEPDDLRLFLGEITDEEFESICTELRFIHGTDGPQFKRVDRLVNYTSFRYVVRDFCQIQQRTMRQKLSLQTSAK